MCSGGCGQEETINHLFLEYDFFFFLVYDILFIVGLVFLQLFHQIFGVMHRNLFGVHAFKKDNHLCFRVMCLAYLWFIWKEFNSKKNIATKCSLMINFWIVDHKQDFTFDFHFMWSLVALYIGYTTTL